jgi:hypothetical protein
MTMDYRANPEANGIVQARALPNPEANGIVQARALLAAAAKSVNHLESAAEQALDCLAALTGQWCPCHHSAGDVEQALDRLAELTGMLSQLEELAGLQDPDAAAAAARYAAAVCRDAQALVRSLDTLSTRLAVVTVLIQQAPATPSTD